MKNSEFDVREDW